MTTRMAVVNVEFNTTCPLRTCKVSMNALAPGRRLMRLVAMAASTAATTCVLGSDSGVWR